MATPFFKELSDEALRTEYWGWRALAFNGAQIVSAFNLSPRSRAGRKAGGNVCRALRYMEIIEGIARKRGISLARQQVTEIPAGGGMPPTAGVTIGKVQ